MSLIKKILVVLLLACIIIQFFRPARNTSTELLSADITKVVPVPEGVLSVLKRSCYDCHSNNTAYPWYMNIQPVAWYLAHHVKEGKHELNFSEFGSYKPKKQLHKLQEIAKEVKEGEMPLSSYTLIHSRAKLSEDEKLLVVRWADSLAATF